MSGKRKKDRGRISYFSLAIPTELADWLHDEADRNDRSRNAQIVKIFRAAKEAGDAAVAAPAAANG